VDSLTFSNLEESVRQVGSLAKDDSLKLGNLLKDHKDLSFEVDRVKDIMSRKADLESYKRLEEKFNHYTPISKFL
jgi:hypothetical protein